MVIPFQNVPFLKEFPECINYIPSYFPKLEYAQWVRASTPDSKIHSSNLTDVHSWTMGPNLITRLSVSFWSKSHNNNFQVCKADSLSVWWPKVGFRTAKKVIKNDKIVVWNLCKFFHENLPYSIPSVDQE